MNNSYLFIALLLLLALMLTFFFPPIPALAADDHCWIEYAWPDCNDSNLFNGYWWRDEGFVPGMITRETHFISSPPLTAGYSTYYAEGLMEATAKYMGLDLTDYVDGVAMMSCADIGQTVWIKSYHDLFEGWEGPFLVVDCAEWDDHYAISIFRKEIVEVGYKTAKRWGLIDQWTAPVYVLKSRWKPPEDYIDRSVVYHRWFKEVARYYSARRVELPTRYVYDGSGRWLIGGGWQSFLAWQDNPMYIEPWIRDAIYRIGD